MPRDLGILALLALAEACGGSGGTAGGVGDARYVASDSGEGGFQPGEGFVPLGNADASAPDAVPTADAVSADAAVIPDVSLPDVITVAPGDAWELPELPPLIDAVQGDAIVIVDGATWDYALPQCGDQDLSVAAPVVPASVLLVVDRSESMDGQKWLDTKAALSAILTEWGPKFSFGLLMFPKADKVCVVANTPDVAFALNNGPTITAMLDSADLKNGTPTGGAMVAAKQIMANVPATGPRLVILATDGAPTCPSDCSICNNAESGICLGSSCALCLEKKKCIQYELKQTAEALAANGVPTYVIGLPGSDKATDSLNMMAQAGGTAIPGQEAQFYTATDAATLATAIGGIASSVQNCTTPVEPVPGYAFAIVEIDGVKVAKDPTHTNGWDLVEGGKTLQFFGPACEKAAADGADVQIKYACKS